MFCIGFKKWTLNIHVYDLLRFKLCTEYIDFAGVLRNEI